jgi:hypothetical protein
MLKEQNGCDPTEKEVKMGGDLEGACEINDGRTGLTQCRSQWQRCQGQRFDEVLIY